MSLNKGKLIRCFHHNLFDTWAVVVVKWSAYLPSIQTIRVRIPLTPTVFSVPFADDPYSWERARFFLENYIGSSSGHTSVVTRVVGDRWSLASNPTVQQYVYEVSKDAGEGAYTYQVSCIPGTGGDINQAVLNAGNLARFIREGKLEISLLAPR